MLNIVFESLRNIVRRFHILPELLRIERLETDIYVFYSAQDIYFPLLSVILRFVGRGQTVT